MSDHDSDSSKNLDDYLPLSSMGSAKDLFLKNAQPRAIYVKGTQFSTTHGINDGMVAGKAPKSEAQPYCTMESAYTDRLCKQ